jgi:hypothetical protein
VTPTLQLSAGTYRIYVTKGTSGNASPDLIVNLTATGGSLSDTNGAPLATIPLSVFQAANSNNVWCPVGYITNTTATPTITFTYISGAAAATGGRWYMDGVRFENLDPCTGIAPLVGVTGPLAAGQTNVNVTGVVAGATNVAVFANTVLIGQTNFSGGFAAGTLSVPTSPLVKDAQITATQTKTNGLGGPCTSQPPASGPPVGGGANPKINLSLGLAQNGALTGPIGTTSSGAGTLYWLKSTGTSGGASATAPEGGQELIPQQCWQTVTFDWASDSALEWQSNIPFTETNAFVALESLAFAINESDTGPYDIYIDEIKNGNTVVEDFEGYNDGTSAVTFVSPNTATLPIPGNTFVASPNSSAISQSHVFSGTNAYRLQWQFKDTAAIRWARVLANSSTGKKYPQLDTHQQVTMHVLVLPVGQNVDLKFNGVAGNITNSATPWSTTTNQLGVSVTGSGVYTYQWSLNGNLPPNPSTSATYTIGDPSGINVNDNGNYTVVISDGSCTETRSYSFTAINPIPVITNQPVHLIVNAGAAASFTVGADGHVPGGYPLTYQWRTNGIDITGETSQTLSIPNAQIANVAPYDVVVGNSFGSVTSAVATLDVVPIGITVGTGTGLRGNYYTSHFSTNAFSGTPALSRIDPQINFIYGNGSPDAGISSDFFTARWAGQVQALGDDTYTFYTVSDDGVRLWVNGQKLVDNWTLHAPTTNSASVALTGTQKYDVFMEYFEGAVTAVAKLYWSTASGSVGIEPVPTSQLYPANTIPVQPTVDLAVDNTTNLIFNWGPGQYTIVWATNVTGPYTNKILGATSPYTNVITPGATKFFRLQVQ